MTTLTPEQISAAADAAREAITQGIDTYINAAIKGVGANPVDVSDEQYTEIIDQVFGCL